KRVALEDFLADPQVVVEALQAFLDEPPALMDHALVERHGRAIRQCRGHSPVGRITQVVAVDCRAVRVAVTGRLRNVAAIQVVTERFRVGAGEQGVGRQIAAEIQKVVRDRPTPQRGIEAAAEVVQVATAAIGEICVLEIPQRVWYLDVLNRTAVVGAGRWIEPRIGGEVVARALDHRDRRDELVLVVQFARPQHERAVVPVVGQRGGQLAALVGLELWRAHAIGRAIEAADAGVPAVLELEPVEAVDAPQALVAIGQPDVTGWFGGALAQNEVGGRAHLAGAEYGARATLHDFNALDRVVKPEQRARVHERQRGHTVDRRTVDHVGEEWGVATTRETCDLDVGTGLAAGGLRPDTRGNLQEIGDADRIGLLDFFAVRRDDVVTCVELADAGRGSRHHDGLQGLGFLLPAPLVGGGGLRGGTTRSLPACRARFRAIAGCPGSRRQNR